MRKESVVAYLKVMHQPHSGRTDRIMKALLWIPVRTNNATAVMTRSAVYTRCGICDCVYNLISHLH